jgi:hypothetical protein
MGTIDVGGDRELTRDGQDTACEVKVAHPID